MLEVSEFGGFGLVAPARSASSFRNSSWIALARSCVERMSQRGLSNTLAGALVGDQKVPRHESASTAYSLSGR
jgi:hypothetical protein